MSDDIAAKVAQGAISLMFGLVLAGLIAIAGGRTLAMILIAALGAAAFDAIVWN